MTTKLNKVAIIAKLPPPYHGSNVMAKILIDVLNDAGYQVEFISKNFALSMEDMGTVNLRKFISFFRVIFKVAISNADIFIVFMTGSLIPLITQFFYILTIIIKRKKFICRFGGLGFLKYKDNFLIKSIIKFILKNMTIGEIKSETLIYDIEPYLSLKAKIRVIPNTIDVKYLPYTKKTNNNSISSILFLSNLLYSKGILETIKAIDLLVNQYGLKKIKLLVVGSITNEIHNGKLFYSILTELIIEKKLGSYIKFFGALHDIEKWKILQKADIFVFPTHYETFGIVNIEAMAAGLPVISTDFGPIPEIVKNNETGFIVPVKNYTILANRIYYLVKNPKIAIDMGLKGRKRFEENYSYEIFKRNYLNLLSEIK